MRSTLEQLTNLVIEYDYANVDEFAAYVTHKLAKSIAYQRQQRVSSGYEIGD